MGKVVVGRGLVLWFENVLLLRFVFSRKAGFFSPKALFLGSKTSRLCYGNVPVMFR